MNFDLRPHMTLDPADSQISEGGLGAVENCTWAALADTIYDYSGVRHTTFELRGLDNALEGLGSYVGGETWGRNVTTLAELNPDLASIAHIEYPSDVVGALRAYGQAGYVVHWAGWCTPNAQWTTGDFNGGISHAGRVIAGDDATLTLWNPWTGYEVTQPDDFWCSSYDGGGILVFKRPLVAGSNDLKVIKGDGSAVCYIYSGGLKFGIATPGELTDYLNLCGQAQPVTLAQFTVDKMPELRSRANGDPLVNEAGSQVVLNAIKAELDALAAHPAITSDPALTATVQAIAAKINKDLA